MIRYRATGQDIMLMPRLLQLVFGIYAWAAHEGKQLVQDAGSGIFIAPGLGLTAKHVSTSFARLDDQFDAYNRRNSVLGSQYAATKTETGYFARVYQASGLGEKVTEADALSWEVRGDWLSFDTDISVLEVTPETPAAIGTAPNLRYFDWVLLPPRVGTTVRVCGYPDAEIEIEDSHHDRGMTFGMESARVVENMYPIARHGMGEFPTFRLDHELPHGFSGGPVLWNEHLVGLFTGPDLVSCLWPLVLLNHTGHSGPSISELFDSDLIHALDWSEVKGRVDRVPCEEALAGRDDHVRCRKKHVILRA